MNKTSFLARLRSGLLTGTLGTIATATVLAIYGQQRTGSLWTPFNATAHMLFGEKSVEKDGFQTPETPVGLALHAAALGGWGVLYELLVARSAKKLPASIATGSAASALVYALDYHVLPEKLRPGFEKRLGHDTIRNTYIALAVVFALAGLWQQRAATE